MVILYMQLYEFYTFSSIYLAILFNPSMDKDHFKPYHFKLFKGYTSQDFQSMPGHFASLCMEGLEVIYLPKHEKKNIQKSFRKLILV